MDHKTPEPTAPGALFDLMNPMAETEPRLAGAVGAGVFTSHIYARTRRLKSTLRAEAHATCLSKFAYF